MHLSGYVHRKYQLFQIAFMSDRLKESYVYNGGEKAFRKMLCACTRIIEIISSEHHRKKLMHLTVYL